MITAPNKYLGISADKLPYIATELEQKNATLTTENVRLQRELEAEHALTEALGHELEQAKAENAKLLDLLTDTWIAFHSATEDEFADVKSRLVEVGIEVE